MFLNLLVVFDLSYSLSLLKEEEAKALELLLALYRRKTAELKP